MRPGAVRRRGRIHKEWILIILGLILLIVGYFTGIPFLYPIGGILLIVGIVFLLLGRSGRAVGGRSNWY